MGGFSASGAGDFSRVIILRDASGGTFEDAELGDFNQGIFGFVERTDDDGLPIRVLHAHPQPRNWHILTKGSAGDVNSVRDRRGDVSLIADHQNEFAGFRLDNDSKSPFLDDWFWDGERVNGSTRIVDSKDPKGRVGLLSQVIIITDDDRQEFSAALNLGPTVGTHDVASAGWIHDGNNIFNGRLSSVFLTNHADKEGEGREATPFGCLEIWHDAHVGFPGVAHGRMLFGRDDCDDYEEMPAKLGGGGEQASDSGGGGEEPRVHYYKSKLLPDHTRKGIDTRLVKENAQWRPVYHCVDVPERKKITIINNVTNYSPTINNDNRVTNNNSLIIIVIIVQGGGGGGTKIGPDHLIVPFTDGGGRPIETTPPPGDHPEGGRVICMPLSHNPPLVDGIEHRTHGYAAFSEDGKGRTIMWVGGQGGQPPFDPKTLIPGGTGRLILRPDGTSAFEGTGGNPNVPFNPHSYPWDQVVSIPFETPAGRTVITDGRGGYQLGEPPLQIPSDAAAVGGNEALFDLLGWPVARGEETGMDGFVFERDEDDERILRWIYRVGGETIDEAFKIDGSGLGFGYLYERLVVTKPAGTTDGYVPIADTEFGVTWVDPATLGGGAPKGYVVGFGLTYDPDFPSQVAVEGGRCRDSTNVMDIAIDDPDVDSLTQGGPLFNDAIPAAETVITASVVNGATEADSTAFTLSAALPLGLIPVRTITGAVSLSSRDAKLVSTMTPTVAGTTRFKSELKPGDLVGNATYGYGCVLAVDSDSSARVMLYTAGPLSGQTYVVYENCSLQCGASNTPSKFIRTLASSLDAGTVFGQLNGNTNASGLGVALGQPPPGGKTYSDNAARSYDLQTWVFLWARAQADGTSTLSWSTQRTEPYSPSSLTDYEFWRRVGVLPVGTDNFFPPFAQTINGGARTYRIQDALSGGTTNPFLLANSPGNTGWTRVLAGRCAPPTSKALLVTAEINNPSGTATIFVRQSGLGSSTTSRPEYLGCFASARAVGYMELALDDGQAFDYVTNSAGVGNVFNLTSVGYVDDLGAGGGGATGSTSTVADVAPNGIKLRLKTAQSCADNDYTKLSFQVDSALWDPDGWFSFGTPDRITCPAGKGGKYAVAGGIAFAANGNGLRGIDCNLNDSGAVNLDYDSKHFINGGGAEPSSALFSTTFDISPGDYIEVFGYLQGVGSALNALGDNRTFLTIYRVG